MDARALSLASLHILDRLTSGDDDGAASYTTLKEGLAKKRLTEDEVQESLLMNTAVAMQTSCLPAVQCHSMGNPNPFSIKR